MQQHKWSDHPVARGNTVEINLKYSKYNTWASTWALSSQDSWALFSMCIRELVWGWHLLNQAIFGEIFSSQPTITRYSRLIPECFSMITKYLRLSSIKRCGGHWSVELDDFLPPIVASASDICLPLDLPSLANTVPFNYYRAFQRSNTLSLYSEPISLRHLKFL